MREIDEMDMLGFLCVRAWNANRKRKFMEPKASYIDNVWPGLKP